MTLLPHHRALLAASAIAPTVAEARGYRSLEDRHELERLHFASACTVPGLLIPLWGVDGIVRSHTFRPDTPRIDVQKGKARKYELPKGSKSVLDVPPMVHGVLGDVSVDLWVTEGARKADAAVSVGLSCLSISGVWNFRIPDWDDVALDTRRVWLCFDSDIATNQHVGAAVRGLLALLARYRAQPRVVLLPPGPNGSKTGLDDFLARHTREELLALANIATTAPPRVSRASSVICVRDVRAENVDWLWERRLPRGMLMLLVGDGGIGKSTLTLAFGATLSRAARWPDGTQAPFGRTLLLSAEDSVSVTIRPRLEALDADLDHVYVLQAVREGDLEQPFVLERDLEVLRQTIRQTAAALVIIDPISAYFGDRDSYKDTEVRGVLGPLAALAADTGTCVLAVMHVSKAADRTAQHRVLGGVGFVNAARLVLGVGHHPDDGTSPIPRRVLVPVKQNICAPADALGFTLQDGRLLWMPDPVSGVSADDVFRSASVHRPEAGAMAAAKSFLGELLAKGAVLSTDILRQAGPAGIARRTLFRAKSDLGITAHRMGYGSDGEWSWELPPKSATADAPSKSATAPETLALYEPDPEKSSDFPEAPSKSANVSRVALFEVPDDDDDDWEPAL